MGKEAFKENPSNQNEKLANPGLGSKTGIKTNIPDRNAFFHLPRGVQTEVVSERVMTPPKAGKDGKGQPYSIDAGSGFSKASGNLFETGVERSDGRISITLRNRTQFVEIYTGKDEDKPSHYNPDV